jgi:hypothetical protein
LDKDVAEAGKEVQMIEQDVYVYFKQDATLSGYLGGNEKIYLTAVPTDGPQKMPWVVVEKTGGTRRKISQSKTEEMALVRITVDAGPDQIFMGATIAEHCLKLLENYRGQLDQASDVYIESGAIRSWAGFGNAYRYQFDTNIRFTEGFNRP